jgi:hypothetical protein
MSVRTAVSRMAVGALKLVFGLALAVNVTAATYFVRPAGAADSGGNGASFTNAWPGVGAIRWRSIKPGDTVFICGTHREKLDVIASGEAGAPIVISGACPQAGGVLSGRKNAENALPHVLVVKKSHHIRIEDLTVEGTRLAAILVNQGSTHVTMKKLHVRDCARKGIAVIGDTADYVDHILIEDSLVETVGFWGDTAASDLSIGGRARRVVVRNNEFRGDGAGRGVDAVLLAQGLMGSGHVIEHNTFYGHEENEIDIKANPVSPAGEGPTYVRNNDLYGTSDYSGVIDLHKKAGDVIIRDNHIHDAEGSGINIGDYRPGFGGHYLIERNVIENVRKKGIVIRGGIKSGKILNNVLLANGRRGDNKADTGIFASAGPLEIRGNILMDNGDSKHAYQLYITAKDTVLHGNCYFRSSRPRQSADMLYYEGKGRSLLWMRMNTEHADSSIAADPKIWRAEGGKYRMREDSECAGIGIQLGVSD